MRKSLINVSDGGLFHLAGWDWVAGPNPKMKNAEKLWGDCTELTGDCSGVSGYCTGIKGDCTGVNGNLTHVVGNLDGVGLTEGDRKNGVHIDDLIGGYSE